ncbi:TPA: hypothetical protein ACQSOC_000098 [Pseudomonas aeruginosa]
MTESKICTCPSGNGSLRHPCPAHPASVELAGVGAKLTFINGRPAMCGCQVEYSSGGGEYSDVIDVTLCAKHSGSAILDLVATNRIALTPEYEGQWHADFYLDREIPLAKAEGATPAEAVLALMSAERIDPEQESVEQAGGDERVIGWRERILAAHPNSDPGFWPDALLVEHMAAEIADLRAALAQPSPVSEPLIYACKSLAQITSSDGSGHADIALAILRMAGVCDDERERLVNEWKAARAWKPSPAQAEQAEAERPDVVGSALGNIYNNGFDHVAPFPPAPGGPVVDEPLMTVAQHAASVARWAEMFNRVEQERDAALAKVAGLELKLDQSDYAYDNDRCHMRGLAKQAAEAIQVFTGHDSSANLAHRYGEKWWEHLDELRDALLAFAKNAPVAQPEEMPGEILAAKLIETWVTKHGKPAPWSTAVEITAVATNMPNDERDRLLALDDDVDAQAQHSVPGKYDDVLLPFLKSMEHELHANAGKGDRPGWLQMDRRTALLEIYYHLAKLQKATKDNDAAGIVEYAADVANMSMMLVDVCGLLAAAPGKEEV